MIGKGKIDDWYKVLYAQSRNSKKYELPVITLLEILWQGLLSDDLVRQLLLKQT